MKVKVRSSLMWFKCLNYFNVWDGDIEYDSCFKDFIYVRSLM